MCSAECVILCGAKGSEKYAKTNLAAALRRLAAALHSDLPDYPRTLTFNPYETTADKAG